MKDNLYLNGNLRYYGATFMDTPPESMRLHLMVGEDGNYELSGTFNVMQGDVFKISELGWENVLGYWSLEESDQGIYFSPVWDGHDGDNLYCKESGLYKISVNNRNIIHIDYLGAPKENEHSLWQIAGKLSNYENDWGTGSDAMHLYWLSDQEAYNPDYPMSLYDCYHTRKPVFLERGDELKLAIISDGTWVKMAGASLLDEHGNESQKGDDEFLGWGENAGGANIRVEKPGKYYFYLYVARKKLNPRSEDSEESRKNHDEFRIVWTYNEADRY